MRNLGNPSTDDIFAQGTPQKKMIPQVLNVSYRTHHRSNRGNPFFCALMKCTYVLMISNYIIPMVFPGKINDIPWFAELWGYKSTYQPLLMVELTSIKPLHSHQKLRYETIDVSLYSTHTPIAAAPWCAVGCTVGNPNWVESPRNAAGGGPVPAGVRCFIQGLVWLPEMYPAYQCGCSMGVYISINGIYKQQWDMEWCLWWIFNGES